MSEPTVVDLLENTEDKDLLDDLEQAKEGKEFRIQNKRLIVTYKTHIDKITILEFFTAKAATKNIKLKFCRSAHESADIKNPYLHTHVVIEFEPAFESRNCRIFDITTTEIIHPNIGKCKTNIHFENCKRYLAKEDKENADLLTETKSIITQILECDTPLDALKKHCTDPNRAPGIILIHKYKEKPIIDNTHKFKRWQIEMKEILDTSKLQDIEEIIDVPRDQWNTTPFEWPCGPDRMIDVIYNPKGGCAKSKFIKWLVASNPKKYLGLQGVANIRDASTIIESAIENGWEGDTILINLTRQCADYKIYTALEAMRDGMMTSMKYRGKSFEWEMNNMVIFTNFMPNLTAMTTNRWKIRGLNPKYQTLYDIPLAQAILIYNSEKEARKDLDLTPINQPLS